MATISLPPLVTEDPAVTQLRLATPLSAEAEADLTTKLQQASDAIVDYLKTQADPLWDATTVPAIVQAAILNMPLTNLWEHRGDDGAPSDSDNACWMAIERLLRRRQDPALA